MLASPNRRNAAAYGRAARAVVTYLAASARDGSGPARLPAEARALISLAGAAAQNRFARAFGGQAQAAVERAGERAFCGIADAAGWDDRERDRLELFIEALLSEPRVWEAVAAIAEARASSTAETRSLLGQRLHGMAVELPALRVPASGAGLPAGQGAAPRPGRI